MTMNRAVAEAPNGVVDGDWDTFCDSGCKDALAGLLEQHGTSMRAVAMRITRRDADADDAVQMAVERLLVVDRSSLESVRNARSWLLGVTMNCARQLIKQETTLRARHQRAQEQEPGSEEICFEYDDEPDEQQALLKQVDESLMELPKNYQEPVMLHYLEGMQFSDVGEALGRSEEAVKKQAQRGIKKLRDILRRRGVPVAMALLIGLLNKLQAVAFSDSSRIPTMVSCLRTGQSFPVSVPAYDPLKFSTGLPWSVNKILGVGLLIICTALFLWLRNSSDPEVAHVSKQESVSHIGKVKAPLPQPVKAKHQWRDISFNEVSSASGVIERYGDIVAGSGGDFKEPTAEGDNNQPIWFINSPGDKKLITLVLKQSINNPIYEVKYKYRVLKKHFDNAVPALGILARQSEGPAKREILFDDPQARQQSVSTDQWHEVLIRVESVMKNGAAWSHIVIHFNGGICTDLLIQIPSNSMFAPFAAMGMDVELIELQAREIGAEL